MSEPVIVSQVALVADAAETDGVRTASTVVLYRKRTAQNTLQSGSKLN